MPDKINELILKMKADLNDRHNKNITYLVILGLRFILIDCLSFGLRGVHFKLDAHKVKGGGRIFGRR